MHLILAAATLPALPFPNQLHIIVPQHSLLSVKLQMRSNWRPAECLLGMSFFCETTRFRLLRQKNFPGDLRGLDSAIDFNIQSHTCKWTDYTRFRLRNILVRDAPVFSEYEREVKNNILSFSLYHQWFAVLIIFTCRFKGPFVSFVNQKLSQRDEITKLHSLNRWWAFGVMSNIYMGGQTWAVTFFSALLFCFDSWIRSFLKTGILMETSCLCLITHSLH